MCIIWHYCCMVPCVYLSKYIKDASSNGNRPLEFLKHVNVLPILNIFFLMLLWWEAIQWLKAKGWRECCLRMGSVRVNLYSDPVERKRIIMQKRNFPAGPVGRTPSSQCKGPGFIPWLGNWIPHSATKSSHAATKKSTCSNWRSCVPQLRPGTA